MHIIENLKEMTETARGWLASGTVGFVPIKSTIHDGHRMLIQSAQRACKITVVGLLGNAWPLDTNDERIQHRQNLTRNLQLLNKYNVDVVFTPRLKDMYPARFATYVTPTGVLLEDRDTTDRERIQRFATVATKLFHLVRPDVVYYGQKDAQQVAIIRQLVRDLNMDIRMSVLPTVRESDGLAISSRNSHLSVPERQAAALIYQALLSGKALIENGERDATTIKQAMASLLQTNPLITIERIAICNPDTLKELPEALLGMLLLIDVRISSTRFTDNIIWKHNGQWSL
jgi:pantoate--beta-alanine ligase